MSALLQNTYPTTPQQLFLEQQMRDDNNPGCIAFRESEDVRRRKKMLSSKQQKEQEEATKKWEADQIAGYASKRFDFPQYQWRMYQDGKEYLRSSKNFNVYDYSQSSVIVGIWNEETQRIEFVNDLMTRVRQLEEIVKDLSKLTATIV
jgi:hypothetical protein